MTTTFGAIDNASLNFFEAPHGGGACPLKSTLCACFFTHTPARPHATGITGKTLTPTNTPPLHAHPHAIGIMGMSFGNYALCDAEFSCFPPLIDDVVSQLGLPDK